MSNSIAIKARDRIEKLIYPVWLLLGRFCKSTRLDHVKKQQELLCQLSWAAETEGSIGTERAMLDTPDTPEITEGAVLEMTVEKDGIIYRHDFVNKTSTIENFLRHSFSPKGGDSDGIATRAPSREGGRGVGRGRGVSRLPKDVNALPVVLPMQLAR